MGMPAMRFSRGRVRTHKPAETCIVAWREPALTCFAGPLIQRTDPRASLARCTIQVGPHDGPRSWGRVACGCTEGHSPRRRPGRRMPGSAEPGAPSIARACARSWALQRVHMARRTEAMRHGWAVQQRSTWPAWDVQASRRLEARIGRWDCFMIAVSRC